MATRIGEWDPPPPVEGVVRHDLFLDGVLVGAVPEPATSFTFSNVLPGTHVFGVEAVGTEPPPDDRSDRAEVTQDVHGKPGKPQNFTVHK